MSQPARYPFKVSIIVPAMNEEGNIDEFVALCASMFRSAPFDGELVYVNDGSTDKTLSKIESNARAHPFIRFASHARNRGLTEALQTGFATATGDVYVFYPADLQYLPEDIPALVAPINNGADIVTGWKQGKYNKRFVSTIYNWMSRTIFGLKVHDLNSVKAFRKEILDRIFLRQDWHRYLVVLAHEEGYRVEEVKVSLYDRKWGKTKFSLWRIPVGVLDMLAVKFQLTFLKKPLLYFGGAGACFLLLAFLVGIFAIYQRYVLMHGDRNFIFLVILLVLLGMSFFLLGFVSEGQTAMKEELTDLRKKTDRLLTHLSRKSDHN